MSKTNRTIAAVLTAAALTALSACGGNDGDDGSKPEVRTVTETVTTGPVDDVLSETPSADSDADSDAEPTEEPSTDPSLVVHTFGDEGATLSTGLAVKVSELSPYRPTEGAYWGEEKFSGFVTFTVTITNGTGKVYDVGGSFTSTATTGERESQEVYDSKVGGAPSTKVLPGKTISFDQAYGVDKGSDFVLYVSPDYEVDEELIYAS